MSFYQSLFIYLFLCILFDIGNGTLFEYGYTKEYENRVIEIVKEMG